jgi:hypothetical protein
MSMLHMHRLHLDQPGNSSHVLVQQQQFSSPPSPFPPPAAWPAAPPELLSSPSP